MKESNLINLQRKRQFMSYQLTTTILMNTETVRSAIYGPSATLSFQISYKMSPIYHDLLLNLLSSLRSWLPKRIGYRYIGLKKGYDLRWGLIWPLWSVILKFGRNHLCGSSIGTSYSKVGYKTHKDENWTPKLYSHGRWSLFNISLSVQDSESR